jgi:hypothetical protein
MKVAHLEFEAKLRWLLPLDKRKDDFEYSFNGPQSVKHLIQSVGIPHTEIGEIKATGEPIESDYLVQDGDRIEVKAVLPLGEQIAEPCFVLDSQLGRLRSNN